MITYIQTLLSRFNSIVLLGATLTLLVPGLAVPALAAPMPSVLNVSQDASGHVTVDKSKIHAGLARVAMTSQVAGSYDIMFFKPNPGASLEEFRHQMIVAHDTAATRAEVAAALRWTTDNLTFHGGLQNTQPSSSDYKLDLAKGNYFVADLPRFMEGDEPTMVRVVGGKPGMLPELSQSVTAVNSDAANSDKFEVAAPSEGVLQNGTVRLTNMSANELYFFGFFPVRTGTTDAQIQAFYDGTSSDNPFVAGPTQATAGVSPGVALNFEIDLPAGTYAVQSFIPDPATGFPQGRQGMHTVVRIED
jgi:hypothetical protein